jgi:hypothetical protein
MKPGRKRQASWRRAVIRAARASRTPNADNGAMTAMAAAAEMTRSPV